mgnify:CR=1 FL=1
MEGFRLEKIRCYNSSHEISNKIWLIVNEWNFFNKKTVGVQFVRSIDSVSANLTEGFYRDTKKDKIRFYRIAIASCYESLEWYKKAKSRGLIQAKFINELDEEIIRLPLEINYLISLANRKLKY